MAKYKQFKDLYVPEHWQHYYTKYPEGYTILESLIDWVSQVNDLTENVNNWNEYLKWFVDTFDERITPTVREMLNEMEKDGRLADIINKEIFGELNNKIDNAYNVFSPYNTDINSTQAYNRFIDMMNSKATEYQMTSTRFANPHGIDNTNQYTNAFDMLLMGMQATGYDRLMEIMARRKHMSRIEGDNARSIDIETSVDMSSINDHHILVGAKTGTVTSNGNRVQNLISFAQPKKTASFFVSAVMNATPSRYTSARHLYDIAQSSIESKFDFKYHTNNLTNGNFDEGFDGWTTSGSPIFDRVEYFMFPQSVNVGSNGTSNYVSRVINLTPGNIYYVSAYVKCIRYASGYIGLQVSGDGETKNSRLARTTRGWSKRSIRFVAETSGATINVGGMENADLDGWIDGVNVINLTSAYGQGSEPSKDYMDSEQWRNISGGADGAGIVAQVPPKANAYDRSTIEVLFEKNARVSYPPASLTKIMTAMLLLDYETDLSSKVQVISSDLTGGSGSDFYAGDILTLKDCLYHLLLESSNTIAKTIARNVGKKVLLYEKLGIGEIS